MTQPPFRPATDLQPRHGVSNVKGDTSVPLLLTTVSSLLHDTATKFPDRPAVVFREQHVRRTWRELTEAVDALAAGLHTLGLRKGDRLGIWAPNRIEWLTTQFATARIGVILVNINPAYRLAELEYTLNRVGCNAIITAEVFKSSSYLEMLQTLAPELSTSEPGALSAIKVPTLRYVIRMGDTRTPGMLNYNDIIDRGRGITKGMLDALSATLDTHDPINIQFTSGTTGAPKGATLTHHNIVNNGRFVAMAMKLSERDILCVPVPLYHCFGMVTGVLACTSAGAAMVFPSETFDPDATMQAVSEERCTALHGVPTMFIAQLDHPNFKRYDFSSLRTGIMAGSPCPLQIMQRVIAEMHIDEMTIAYGMTETSPVSFQNATDDPLEKRVATVGRVQPHLEVKIIDPEGVPTPIGETGELCTRGYAVMRGYWDDPQKTAEAIVDGWMHTGDLATLDENGYCAIVGRAKDMLIRGGENIYPREIEEFLFRHPKVQAVQVFGVPDAKYGEAVCAWIVLKSDQHATEDEIRQFCQDQIAHYKIPRYIRFVDDMPMTISGKVQKFIMREQMMNELRAIENKKAE